MTVTVRPMEVRDIELVIGLTDLEGWGYGAKDFRRLISLEPGGCVVAEHGGRVVGVTTITSYGGVAWIGSVIVDPHQRGKGVGRAMMERVHAYAESTGVPTTRLNAYLHAVPFYNKLGYRAEFENIRFLGTGRGKVYPGVHQVTAGDVEAITRFDEPFFGASRSKVFSALLYDYRQGFFSIVEGDEPLGYIVAGESSDGAEIGPWVVNPRHPKVAEGLLLHALAVARGRQVSFSSPIANTIAVALAHAHGLDESFRTLRMYRGRREHGGDPRGYFALGGLEKG